MKKLVLAAAALCLPFAATPALAEHHEMAKPELLEQNWYRILYLKFHPNNGQRIREINEMFGKASKASGRDEPFIMHMNTGNWDWALFFRMKHGIQQMGWKERPGSEAWNKALAELAGGEEEANAIWAEWRSMIADSTVQIGHNHNTDEE